MSSFVERFISFFEQCPLAFGMLDIYSDGPLHTLERIGAFAFLMHQVQLGKDRHRIQEVVIVLPPVEAQTGLTASEIRRKTLATAEEHLRRTLSAKEVAAINAFIRVKHADHLRTSSAVDALRGISERGAAMITFAGSYRSEIKEGVPSQRKFTLPEDLWVPHVVELVKAAAAVATASNCYVLVDTAESFPQRSENQEAIQSVPNTAVCAWVSAEDPTKVVADNIEQWQSLVAKGHIGSAFAHIDSLPSWMDRHKSLIKLQLIEKVAPGHEVAKLLKSELINVEPSDGKVQLKLASIAQKADDEDTAKALLARAAPLLCTEEDLALALTIAGRLSEADLTDDIAERLRKLFPGSPRAAMHNLNELLASRQYQQLLDRTGDLSTYLDREAITFFRTLAETFLSSEPRAYRNILDAIKHSSPTFYDRAVFACAQEAIARQQLVEAMDLCMPSEGEGLTRANARMLLTALRRILLSRSKENQLIVPPERLIQPVTALISYLANHPDDGGTRIRLASLLSVETSGMLGLAIIAMVVIDSAESVAYTEEPKSKDEDSGAPTPATDITPAITSIFEWMQREGPIILATAKLPRDVLKAPPNELFLTLRGTLRCVEDFGDASDLKTFEMMLFAGVLVAPFSDYPNEDIDLIRYAGARLVTGNQAQRARDYAEQALELAGKSDIRKRLAWFAFADIYHHCKLLVEALIGVACVFAINVSIEVEQMWSEAYLLARLLRDLHFSDQAKAVLMLLRAVAARLDPPSAYERRIQTLELGILLHDSKILKHRDPEALRQITTEVQRHCSDLLEAGEDVGPGVALLVQCVYFSTEAGVPVLPEVRSTLQKALAKVSRPLADLVHALGSEELTAQHLLSLVRQVGAARNVEDIAFDLKNVAMAGRRVLDSQHPTDAAEAAFVVELLADHALRGSLIGTSESPFEALTIPLNRASEISSSGIRVILLALSELGQLLRISIGCGRPVTVVYERHEVFSGKRFHEWTLRYPYGYAAVANPMNLFYKSMESIGLSLDGVEPSVLIMDNVLQQLPPNLIMINGEFAGRVMPMAAAPSISWLWSKLRVSSVRSGRKAWISTEFDEHKNPALVTVAERLEECFGKYNVVLNTNAELPDTLENSELLVVAAHGGILPEGRFIQRLSDDSSLAMYPSTLAWAARNSLVVVLFVCSGGRVDSHPGAETTVGLVKDLLDGGCDTVIAAPWPLDVRVPSHWLPVFLQHWTAGLTVSEAAYLANKNVQLELGDSPLDSLAMNVFGNPIARQVTKIESVQ